MTKKQIANRFKEVGLKFETSEPQFGICSFLKETSKSYNVFATYTEVSPFRYLLPVRNTFFVTENLGVHTKKHDYIRAILCYLISEAVKSE